MTQIEAHESWWQRWGVRLLPALTFLVGLALAAVVVRAIGPQGDPAATQPPAPSPSASSQATSPDTVVTLPGACEDAAANITEATKLLDDAASAVRDFEPQKLVDLLNQLEDIDNATRPLAQECSRVDVAESGSPSTSPSTSPSASPSETASESPSE